GGKIPARTKHLVVAGRRPHRGRSEAPGGSKRLARRATRTSLAKHRRQEQYRAACPEHFQKQHESSSAIGIGRASIMAGGKNQCRAQSFQAASLDIISV